MNKDGDLCSSVCLWERRTSVELKGACRRYIFICSSVLYSGEHLLWELSLSRSPLSLINCCSCILLSLVTLIFLPPSHLNALLLHLLTQSPPSLSVVVVMEMLPTSRGISWQNSGVQGLGWRVTVGVGSQWEFSLYRLQWRQNLLGKAINRCLFVFSSVRLSFSAGLLTCLSV